VSSSSNRSAYVLGAVALGIFALVGLFAKKAGATDEHSDPRIVPPQKAGKSSVSPDELARVQIHGALGVLVQRPAEQVAAGSGSYATEVGEVVGLDTQASAYTLSFSGSHVFHDGEPVRVLAQDVVRIQAYG